MSLKKKPPVRSQSDYNHLGQEEDEQNVVETTVDVDSYTGRVNIITDISTNPAGFKQQLERDIIQNPIELQLRDEIFTVVSVPITDIENVNVDEDTREIDYSGALTPATTRVYAVKKVKVWSLEEEDKFVLINRDEAKIEIGKVSRRPEKNYYFSELVAERIKEDANEVEIERIKRNIVKCNKELDLLKSRRGQLG